jgi:hypothetical protein
MRDVPDRPVELSGELVTCSPPELDGPRTARARATEGLWFLLSLAAATAGSLVVRQLVFPDLPATTLATIAAASIVIGSLPDSMRRGRSGSPSGSHGSSAR